MKTLRYFILCLLAGSLLLSCEKENFGSEDIIIGTGNGFEKEEVEGDLPIEEEIKKEFIDTTDWTGYDESGNNLFSLPKSLYELGTDYYLK